MIEKLKTIPTNIILYDLISTSKTHKDLLYALFKKEIVPTKMYVAMFSKKLRSIKECDAISFYRYEKFSKELLVECLALYITPMIDGWEIKTTSIDNGSAINVCSHKVFIQLQEKGVEIPPFEDATFIIRAHDTSSKKLVGIATILVTIGVRIVET